MTCYCGAPIEAGVLHPSGAPVYCSTECRRDALLAAIAEHLDTIGQAATDAAFVWGERR